MTVFLLTPAMRAALYHALKVGSWTSHGPAQARMARTLCDSGLLRSTDHGGQYRNTAAGRLALTAKPDGRVWWFSAPELRTVRDVRRLKQCQVCKQLGSNLPTHEGTTAHGACLVRRHGWPVIVEMADVQLARFRAEDLVFLGVTLAAIEAARGRELRTRSIVSRA